MLGKEQDVDIRKRKVNNSGEKTREEDGHVEPLDEDDQARMIEHLRGESARQQESILHIFSFLCFVAGAVLILSVIYLDQWHLVKSSSSSSSSSSLARKVDNSNLAVLRMLSISHGVSSSLLHVMSPHLSRPCEPVGIMFRWAVALDILVAASVLWACRRLAPNDDTMIILHYGILASNGLIGLAAVLLRLDAASTDKAFRDLVHAQYRYKSL